MILAGNVALDRWASDIRLRRRAPDVWEPDEAVYWGKETVCSRSS